MAAVRKFLKNKYAIYLLITITPSIIISYIIAVHQAKAADEQYKVKAQWYANFHAMNIQNFLGETAGRMEMLATSIKVQHNDLPDLEQILLDTQKKDERFSGFYWTNEKGDILISTNPTSSPVNVSDRPYFQQALKTERTSISEAHIGRVTGRYIITLATPIIDHGNVEGVLLASLRLDKIEETIKTLLKEEMITVMDKTNQPLILAGSGVAKNRSVKSSTSISPEAWTVTAYIPSQTESIFWRSFVKYLIIFLTILNIMFLWTKYLLLQQKIKKEKEQAELHKLELVGNIAASTAHEIRNPLTGIKGLIKLLSEDYKEPKAQEYFEVIQTEIDRINAIVSELLVLGKPTAYKLNTYNMNDVISEIEPIILSETNFMNVELDIEYADTTLPVSCVKDHLKQVILNLSKNSLQAMPHGGRLTISLEQRDSYVLIRVADTGVGMKEEQLKHVFKPFYTLKKDGSGLGLTVCKRIIDTYGGDISIESMPGHGTIVEISLPLSSDK